MTIILPSLHIITPDRRVARIRRPVFVCPLRFPRIIIYIRVAYVQKKNHLVSLPIIIIIYIRIYTCSGRTTSSGACI